jgi:hypothetical protein
LCRFATIFIDWILRKLASQVSKDDATVTRSSGRASAADCCVNSGVNYTGNFRIWVFWIKIEAGENAMSAMFHAVPMDCINQAVVAYAVPASLVMAIIYVEGGSNGKRNYNTNGTYDYGVIAN